MGKIEKLVVLGVLLVIVGILGATQMLPAEGRLALGAEPGDVEVTPVQDGGAEPQRDPWAGPEIEPEPVGAPESAPAASPMVGRPEPQPEPVEAPAAPPAAELAGDLLTMEGLEAYPLPGYWVYEVAEGDTFESLAERLYGGSERAVLLRRDNEGLAVLAVGEEILVSELDDGYTGAATHVVQQGESLWSIAEAAYGKGWLHERIQAANADQLGTGAQLKPGMVLRLPSAE